MAEQYSTRWNLPADYPMVPPAYAETRHDLAKKIGLGRKPSETKAVKAAPAKRQRKAPAEAPAADA